MRPPPHKWSYPGGNSSKNWLAGLLADWLVGWLFGYRREVDSLDKLLGWSTSLVKKLHLQNEILWQLAGRAINVKQTCGGLSKSKRVRLVPIEVASHMLLSLLPRFVLYLLLYILCKKIEKVRNGVLNSIILLCNVIILLLDYYVRGAI